MGTVLEKPSRSSSVTTESKARAQAVSLDTNYAHNRNEQQSNPDLTTRMCRRFRHQTVVMQYNDADTFLHHMAHILHLMI